MENMDMILKKVTVAKHEEGNSEPYYYVSLRGRYKEKGSEKEICYYYENRDIEAPFMVYDEDSIFNKLISALNDDEYNNSAYKAQNDEIVHAAIKSCIESEIKMEKNRPPLSPQMADILGFLIEERDRINDIIYNITH